MTNVVFLDASFWVAYRDADQANHSEASQALKGLFHSRTRITTTLPVMCEIHAAFSRNSRVRAQILEDLWNNPLVHIEDVSHTDQAAAIEILRGQPDKNYSLCDALSFVVMRRLKIRRAASFDKHFRQFGEFEIIPEKFP